VILWNHRWEHDKNPDVFFESLRALKDRKVDFGLVILGESFKEYPAVFDRAREALKEKILHAGYVPDQRDYANMLSRCDIVVSTSDHEFFGISIIEAVRAGCTPLVPNRLSYPELFPEEFLYEDNDLTDRLEGLIRHRSRLSPDQARTLTQPYSWQTLAPVYESWFSNMHCCDASE
jgi:glycosyltransferase involved in cell wall biosynthesis